MWALFELVAALAISPMRMPAVVGGTPAVATVNDNGDFSRNQFLQGRMALNYIGSAGGVFSVGDRFIEEQLPIETEVVEDTDSTYAINMTRCQFAEYFRTIGAADVGALLTCGVDFAAEGVLRPDWEFRRTQTLMGGASHCDFRWRLRDSAGRGRESFAQ
jgi:L-2-amino-thiazoline-4-carboxylic acid hydrolase